MRTPSIKTLAQCFDNPTEAKNILRMRHAELSTHPVAIARLRQCGNPPTWSDVRLRVLNSLDSGFYDVESIEADVQPAEFADYLNTGDMYAPTLIFWRGAYRVQSLGDFIERSRLNFTTPRMSRGRRI